ncbi:MAG: gamma-butyrobetaine hydroxylase-like domain-containing protein [Opitutales bacterium]
MTPAPEDLQLIGTTLALRWGDGTEVYLESEFLREHSPSAENVGEVDILGRRHGGDGPRRFPGVVVQRWVPVGRYGIRIVFSDGHGSGIYTWEHLKALGRESD